MTVRAYPVQFTPTPDTQLIMGDWRTYRAASHKDAIAAALRDQPHVVAQLDSGDVWAWIPLDTTKPITDTPLVVQSYRITKTGETP